MIGSRETSDREIRYEVKLFHPINHCQNSGKSEYRSVSAASEIQLRVKVETSIGDIFKGESCKKCSERAKISYSQ